MSTPSSSNATQPNDCEANVPIVQKWVVCEESGRWAAALRSNFARLPDTQPTPRLYEVRTIDELSNRVHETDPDMVLIEVEPKNLTEVLQLLTHRWPRTTRFVALLQDSLLTVETMGLTVADLLWEAGAAEVVESPRQLGRLVAVQNRLAAIRGRYSTIAAERQSLADWAWSTLPWQDG